MDKCYGLMINEKKQKSNRNRTQVKFSENAFEKCFRILLKRPKTAGNEENNAKNDEKNQAFTSGTPRSAALRTMSSETALSVTMRKMLEMGQITEK